MRIPFRSAVRDTIRFGSAIGKVRVLETRIFGSDVYERLVHAPSFDEQLRVLSDTHFGRYLERAETSEDVEYSTETALDEFYRFLEEASLPESVIRFFRVRYDYSNLKAMIKAELLEAPVDEMLAGLGTVEPSAFEGPSSALPHWLRILYDEAVAAAGAAAGRSAGGRSGHGEAAADETTLSGGVRDAEAVVDAAMFADLRRAADGSGSDMLTELVRLMVDVANAKTLVRARRASRSAHEVQGTLLEGGSIKAEELLKLYSGTLADLGARLSEFPALSGMAAEDAVDLERLDIAADNIVLRYVRVARMAPWGTEPVIGYVMAREAQVVTVRVLLIGKLAGLTADELHARLREL